MPPAFVDAILFHEKRHIISDLFRVTFTAYYAYQKVVGISAIQNSSVSVVHWLHGRHMCPCFMAQPDFFGSDLPFGLLVDQEWTSRKNNHLKRLIKQAKFAESGACVEDIEYNADKNPNGAQIARLSTCNFITERHNVLLLGATGSGKTYIACALGMAAARSFLQVRYVKLPELFTELAIARGNGTYLKVIQQYKKPALLIIDEWLLYPLKETEARDLLEITEARYKKASTIFCSQFDIPGWREKIGDPIAETAPNFV